MARLTAAARRKLKPSQFALPAKGKGKDKYPVNDKAHAVNAKSRADHQANIGGISKATKNKIYAKANRALKQFGAKTIDGKPVARMGKAIDNYLKKK